MRKWAAIAITAVLVLAFAVMAYLLLGEKKTIIDPWSAVSQRSCLIIETVDLRSFINSLSTGKGISAAVAEITEFEKFNQKLRYAADNLNKPSFRELIPEGPAVLSFYSQNDGSIRTLLSMAVPGDIGRKQLHQAFSSAGIMVMEASVIAGTDVQAVPFRISGETDTVYFSAERGLLLISTSGTVMKEALATARQGNDIRQRIDFSRIWLSSGKNEDRIFLVFSNLESTLKNALPFDRKDSAGELLRFAGTAGGGIYLNDRSLSVSGYAESTDSLMLFTGLKNVPPREFQTYNILPSSTAFFETVALPGKALITKSPGIDIQTLDAASAIRQYVGGEITRAYIDIRENEASENTVMITRLNNPVMAEQAFAERAAETIVFRPDDQVSMTVYKTVFHGIADAYVPHITGSLEDSFTAFYDSYMITGNSYETVTRVLYDNLLNNTLANDPAYREFESTLPTAACFFMYCSPLHLTAYAGSFLDDDIAAFLRGNKNTIGRISAIGYKLAPSNGMLYNSLSVQLRDEPAGESLTEWETLLDTVACSKPFFFTNHLTGAREIFVQDLNNNVYLINAAGRVLWKVLLNERINGTIYMIDYYGNGKYQLLFAGRNYLHLLDRNGNYVERYPVKLRSPAASPLALFDYDNNRNYRLLITGEDKYVYAYDKSGNTVKGWKPFRTALKAEALPAYFQISGKDYIAVCDASSVYLLDRYGSKRISFREPVVRAPGSVLKLNAGSEYLVCSAPDGTIQQLYFDGKVKKFDVGKYSAGHSFDLFDFDGDGFDEYVFIDKGKLYLYDHNRTEMFWRDFSTGKLIGPVPFIFSSSDRRIGLLDAEKYLIYLLGPDGERMKGFPLKGASMFSVGKLTEKNSWNLIVGSPGRFLYNYKIETEIN